MGKIKKAPDWVIDEIKDLKNMEIDVFDFTSIIGFLKQSQNFQLLEWILENRSVYTYVILSSQDEYNDWF